MCIYYSKRPGLHYDTQEHIFPAAIGGIKMLPKGYVSDEFNNDISKLELDVFRNSIIAVPRQIEGPGKRGSLDPKRATKSKVHVIVDSISEEVTGLGYIKLNKTFEIPQVNINVETGELIMSSNADSVITPRETIKKFRDKCEQAENLKIRIIPDEKLNKGIILFGIEEGIENGHNAFFAHHPLNKMSINSDYIRKIGKSLHTEINEGQAKRYIPLSHLTVKFNEEHFRIDGKIAFNFLAFLKGDDFINQVIFDPVRVWIAEGGSNSFALLDNSSPFLFKNPKIETSDSIHYIMMTKVKDTLVASLAFFGGLKKMILLARNYKEPFALDGLICDWKNMREYRLLEYISKF